MSHVSLYRRFRPDTFDKMVRQEHVVRILKNQIAQNAVGHAYLFCGPRGTGKTTVARIFARAVNCEHPKDGSPCGTCPTCLALAAGSLDISEIDAASNNGVNEMRDLREKVQYPPVTGRYKVYIIDEVHMLTDSAFNALLKTLEEPPAHAIFILATTEPQKLPATILSRCMRLDFKLLPEEDLERHLKGILEEIGKPYEDAAVAAIARAGAGSDRDMLSIAEMCIAYSDTLTYEGVTAVLGAADFKETAALVKALLHADLPAALAEIERILGEGKAVGVLLKDVLEFLNRVTVAKTCREAERLLSLPKELFNTVKDIADGADGRAILRATEILARTETELRLASSPRIALETAVLRVASPESDLDIDALLVRIAKLEEQLAALASAPVAPVATVPVAPAPPAEKAPSKPAQPIEKPEPEPPEEQLFPEEEPVFREAYFSDGPILPAEAPAEKAPSKPAPQPERSKPAPAPQPEPKQPAPAEGGTMTAQAAFAKFLRQLRRTSTNGVLFIMCSDLMASFEGGTFVLTTDVESVYRSLGREEHKTVIAGALSAVGIQAFDIRYAKGNARDDASALEELKKNFKNYPIEVK